jgi:glutaminyl-tRNA synthetase
MPPKFDPKDPATATLIARFTNLGLAPPTATELVRQPKAYAALGGLMDEYGLNDKSFDERTAGALVKLSGVGAKLGPGEKGYIIKRIEEGAIKSPDQVAGGWLGLSRTISGCRVYQISSRGAPC